MKIKHLLSFLFFSAFLGLHAQPKHSIFFNTGYTYNTPIELNEQEVKDSKGFVFNLGGSKQIFFFEKLYIEMGLAAKTVFASGQINDEKFRSSTLRLAVPTRVVFPINKKWKVSTGFIFQNNIDFRTIDLRLRDKYFWRVDLLAEAKYFINDDWYLTAATNINLRNIPDPFFINDPKVAFAVGFGKRIFIVRKKKKKTKKKKR